MAARSGGAGCSQQRVDVRTPAPGADLVLRDEAAAQDARHPGDEDVVLDERAP